QAITSLEDALYWRFSRDGLPATTGVSERAEAVASLRRLLKLEKAQGRAAKKLAKSHSGLSQALLETTAANHETHERLIKLLLESIDSESGNTVRASRWTKALASARPTGSERDRLAA